MVAKTELGKDAESDACNARERPRTPHGEGLQPPKTKRPPIIGERSASGPIRTGRGTCLEGA